MITSYFSVKNPKNKGDNEKRTPSSNNAFENFSPKKQKTNLERNENSKTNFSPPRSLSDAENAADHLRSLLPQISIDTESESERDSPPTWSSELSRYMSRSNPKFVRLASFVRSDRASHTVFPPESETFSALELVPLEKVRVVIIGQDPYHGKGQGHGLAFSVRRGVTPPPSLKNIFKEIISDVGGTNPTHGDLTFWAMQGVLMLNSVLTVRERQAFSHAKKGWEDLTDEIIRVLDRYSGQKKGLVFMLWGNPAAKKCNAIRKDKHAIILTSHPSPLGAWKTKSPFMGSKCFSRCNEELEKRGYAPINWSIPVDELKKADV